MNIDIHLQCPRGPVVVGTAFFTRNRGKISTTFLYDNAYLSTGLPALDPSLPLVAGPQHYAGMIRSLSDTSPDRWGRGLLDKQERARARQAGETPRSLDEVDYLLGVSDLTRQGALRYRIADASAGESPRTRQVGNDYLGPGATVPKLIELPALLSASAEVAAGEETPRALKQLLETGTTGLGGARPKASVLLEDGTLALAKFPHPADSWDVMAWEGVALDLVELAGVPAPHRRLTKIGHQSVLIVRRFDRATQASAGVGTSGARQDMDAGMRIPYLSALSAVGGSDGQDFDYLDLAAAIREYTATPAQQLAQLYCRAVCNVVIGNTDDHLRNHGLLGTWDRHGNWAGWQLSPAFDINPNPNLSARRATTILGADTYEEEAQALPALAAECDLTQKQSQQITARIVDAVENWREIAQKHGITPAQIRQFAEVFAARGAAVRAAQL